jgi:hypothetical protein
MTELRYRSFVPIETLDVGECTIHGLRDSTGKRIAWGLWILVRREDNGEEERLRVPVHVGEHTENGPGGRTWGLRSLGSGEWQVSPSIDFGPAW